MKRYLVTLVLLAALITGCSGRGYFAEPIAEPDSTVDTSGKNFLSQATTGDCFEVTAWQNDGFYKKSISLGTFCRKAVAQ
jgi:hypothetical protein